VNSNRLEHFPAVLTQMPHLKTLEMGDNMIDSIPLNIDRIEALESLELWDNVLAYFPASLSDLPNLRTLDLLHNDMVFEEQEALRNWLPSEVELILSAPCRCDFDE
jgi:Leucine-rich repeat (LRR) protein